MGLLHKDKGVSPKEVDLTRRAVQGSPASDGKRRPASAKPQKGEGTAERAARTGARARRRSRGKEKRDHKPGPLRRLLNAWFERVLGAAQQGSFSDQQAEYAAGQTKQDYLFNTVGQTVWGAVFPLFTIIVTQLVGVDQAGVFSLAMVAGTLLMIVGNYGVRTFQVSDIDERFSFTEYQVNRWMTCALMLLAGYAYVHMRGYDQSMCDVFMAVFVYKMVDALADVYEGRLQQKDKLYLAGASIGVRSFAVLVVFTVFLFVTRNVFVASVAMDVVALVSFAFFTFPLALLETPRSKRLKVGRVASLFKQCFPVFVALFLYALIDNMPKFVMDGVLPYDNQLYFNALYFPAQMVLLIVGFVYKPMLVNISNAWADTGKRRRFDLFVIAMIVLAVVLSVAGVALMAWIGVPLMSFMYGVDFEQFRTLSYIMIAAGGVTGAIDFLYAVITVMRHQRDVTKIYLITTVFALFVPMMLIHIAELRGAVVGYFIVMCILLALLALEYVRVRFVYERHPELDPSSPQAQAARAAEREAARQERADQRAEQAAIEREESRRHGKAVQNELRRKVRNGSGRDARGRRD